MKVYVVVADRDGWSASPDVYASFAGALARAKDFRADTTSVAENEVEAGWASLPTFPSSTWDSVTIYAYEVRP